MNNENIRRLKKYLFFISMLFSVLIWIHVVYTYLYNDADETPVEGGFITQWVIWEFPHINPLKQSFDYNKNILDLVYRSLLIYNQSEKKYVWDLAECDLANIWNIECFLKSDLKWSDWSEITVNDVYATYNILKNSNINPLMSTLLKDVEVSVNENKKLISFKNWENIEVLKILSQKIVAKSILDGIWTRELNWDFNTSVWLYSWPYQINNSTVDETSGIHSLNLVKNKYFTDKEVLIKWYVFKFFDDFLQFSNNKDTINVFFDQNSQLTDVIPRFEKQYYYPNFFLSLFINEEKILNKDFRSTILNLVDREEIVQITDKEYSPSTNLFNDLELKETEFDKDKLDLKIFFNTKWYYKKETLELLEKEKLDWENSTTQTGSVEKIENKVVNPTQDYLVSPFDKKYNFVSTDDEILIEWKAFSWTTEIYINDYKLQSYKTWDENFYYKLNKNFKNFVFWENNYKVEFKIWEEKKLAWNFKVFLEEDLEALEELKNKYKDQVLEEKKSEEIIEEISEENETSTWETIELSRLQRIQELDNNLYYNNDLEPFTLSLHYIQNQKDLEKIVLKLSQKLSEIWILLTPNPIKVQDLNSQILAWEKDYDLMLIGLDLWNSYYNLYPYFHSSTAEKWFNFSKIKNPYIDMALEQLSRETLTVEKRIELEKVLLKYLEEEQTFKTIYQTRNTVYIDKSINNINIDNEIHSDYEVLQSILDGYVSSQKVISFKDKSFKDFAIFIKNIFTDGQASKTWDNQKN